MKNAIERGPRTDKSQADSQIVVRRADLQPEGVPVQFTWRGSTQPALWCPALNGPEPTPMARADVVGSRTGESLWTLDARFPVGARVSWAILPDITAVTGRGVKSAALTPTQRFADRMSRASALDAAITVERPDIPSLFRLIGAEPSTSAAPNVAVFDTATDEPFDWSFLTRAAPTLNTVEVDGAHTLHWAGGELANAIPQLDLLMLDGEVLLRAHEHFAASEARIAYLANRGRQQRYVDAAHPAALAARVQQTLGSQALVHTVVGASAAATTALTVAAALGAHRAVLVSAAPSPQQQEACRVLTRLAQQGTRLELYVGTNESTSTAGQPSLQQFAATLAREMTAVGGDAEVHEFAGGHDLAAWFGVLQTLCADFSRR